MEFEQAVRDQRCDGIDDMLSKGYKPTNEDISIALNQGYHDISVKVLI